ncbi:radical SAM/SPASM domain-containing protein [Magnetococcus sp. PR-3]|uniref:radical SAM/SPASM domain-containing protein n=1 Tax=Magnetococcus sp. PR-3 TaxID=3120355 RepID=UPI002FCE44AB
MALVHKAEVHGGVEPMQSGGEQPYTQRMAHLIAAGSITPAKVDTRRRLEKEPLDLHALYTLGYLYCAQGNLLSGLNSWQDLVELLQDREQLVLLQPDQLMFLQAFCGQLLQVCGQVNHLVTLQSNPDLHHALCNMGYRTARTSMNLRNALGSVVERDDPEVRFMERLKPYRDSRGRSRFHFRPSSPPALKVEPTNQGMGTLSQLGEMTRAQGILALETFEQALTTWNGASHQMTLPYLPHPEVDQRVILSGALNLHAVGEPLLHPHLDQLIAMGRARGAQVHLRTNAILLADTTVRQKLLRNPPDTLQISPEGTCAQEVDAIHGEGSWTRMLQGLTLLHQERAALPDDHTMTITLVLDPHHEAGSPQLTEVMAPLVDRMEPAALVHDSPTPKCREPFYQLNLLWDGTLIPCSKDINARMPLGNVHQQGVDMIWNGLSATDHAEDLLLNRLESHTQCNSCGGDSCLC